MRGMETLVPAISGLLQLAALSVLIGDLWLYRRLTSRYASALLLLHADPGAFPAVDHPDRLAGLEGVTGPIRYRWDPQRRAVIFGRVFEVVPGERGHAVGTVRFGADGAPAIAWRPAPTSPVPLFFLLGCAGLTYFALVEGQEPAWLGVPVLFALCAVIAVLQVANARGTLERLLVPRLADVVRAHLARA